ncbi:MAG: YXWGXW repeat-containing protein [Sandaracinaceae bacterium]
MRERLLASALILGASALGGCYAQGSVTVRSSATFRTSPPRVVVVRSVPPVRTVEVVKPPRPADDAVWVDGYYRWSGTAWIWVGGHWERNRAGYYWVPPVADDREDAIAYHAGYWCPVGEEPPPVYRSRGTVVVSARPVTETRVRQVDERTTAESTTRTRSSTTRRVTVRVGGRVSAGGSVSVGGGRGGQRGDPPASVDPSVERAAARPPRAVTAVDASNPRPTTGTTGSTASGSASSPSGTTGSTASGSAAAPPSGTIVNEERRDGPRRIEPGETVRPEQRPGTGPGAPSTGGSTTPRPGTGPTTPGTPTPRLTPMTCRVEVSRAPRNGLVTLRVENLQGDVTIRHGGAIQPVVRRYDDRLVFRVINYASGPVTLHRGDERSACGTLEVIAR